MFQRHFRLQIVIVRQIFNKSYTVFQFFDQFKLKKRKLTVFTNLGGVTVEEFVSVGNDTTRECEVSDPSLLCLLENIQTAFNRDLSIGVV